MDKLGSRVRLAIAEQAPRHVFVHAGVVSWKGRGILIPGDSLSGKTSLVVELVKLGAAYYSDEYAVINHRGLIEPFPRHLGLRVTPQSFGQSDRSVEEIGGRAGRKNISAGLVVITEYRPGSSWQPSVISSGQGILQMMKHTISARQEPAMAIALLTKLSSATFVRSDRGEADRTAASIVGFLQQFPEK
jgi:hypothetical protein